MCVYFFFVLNYIRFVALLRSYLAGIQEIFINTTLYNTAAAYMAIARTCVCPVPVFFFFFLNCLFCVV